MAKTPAKAEKDFPRKLFVRLDLNDGRLEPTAYRTEYQAVDEDTLYTDVGEYRLVTVRRLKKVVEEA